MLSVGLFKIENGEGRNLKNVLYLIIGCLVFVSCGSDSSTDNDYEIREILISSVGSTSTIDETDEFDLSISGVDNTITIKEGNSINILSISGVDNIIIIEDGVIISEFYVTGTSNDIYVPIDSNLSIEDTGVDNQVIEE